MTATAEESIRITSKPDSIGLRISKKKKQRMKDLARARGISVSELILRYCELGMAVEKYYGPESQLVVHNPVNWRDNKEMGVPYDELINP